MTSAFFQKFVVTMGIFLPYDEPFCQVFSLQLDKSAIVSKNDICPKHAENNKMLPRFTRKTFNPILSINFEGLNGIADVS